MSDWTSSSAVIHHKLGLHARPSVKLTKLAKTFAADIEISNAAEGPWIDAKSIVKVMALKVKQGATLYLRSRGADAAAALAALEGLIARDFDEGAAHAASE